MESYIRGICRVCGCTDLSPCIFSADEPRFGADDPGILQQCSWMDAAHTLCSNFKCVAVVPLDELVEICAKQLAAAAGR